MSDSPLDPLVHLLPRRRSHCAQRRAGPSERRSPLDRRPPLLVPARPAWRSNAEEAKDGTRGYGARMAASDGPTPEEQETAELVKALRATGNLRPLIVVLRAPDGGPERARDALLLLGELDLELLVQVALDTLIDDHVEDALLAHQTRREIRGSDPSAAPS
jgi:hypothetical protein